MEMEDWSTLTGLITMVKIGTFTGLKKMEELGKISDTELSN